ncbi:hypothetical protein G5C60_03320 [Streptomyces sp. HC44]|uniref:Uncharacterized protein n=1 Tax=Streptomyces scabichelini TaxID=2711217 RepID=A0A6G4UY70_9ACTN|nr:hypothetical protein [Streptomyces scabichelini]NGO06722.1 hypothetical protein [Streptomyces scabichelini]
MPLPLPLQPPTAFLASDNPADDDGFLADISTISLGLAAVVFLVAVVLLVWLPWKDRRDQRERSSTGDDGP